MNAISHKIKLSIHFNQLLLCILGSFIVVATGYPLDDGTHIEIINTKQPEQTCNLKSNQQIPKRYRGIVGLLANKPINCGGINDGQYLQECIAIGWEYPTFNMKEKRKFATATNINSQSFIVIGGYDGSR